jgi:hypothetical protein
MASQQAPALTAAYLAESKTTTVSAVVSVLLAFTTALVGLRIYTRAVILKTMGYDDWAIVVALVRTGRPHLATFTSWQHANLDILGLHYHMWWNHHWK